MDLKLYPWQEECLQAWFRHQGRGIVQVVTGAGKTLMALAAASRLEQNGVAGLKVKIIVPKTFMVAQWTASLLDNHSLFGISRDEIGCYFGEHKDPPTRHYMIYVVNSARYSLARHILDDFKQGHPVLIIADECHHYASPENMKIFEFLQHRAGAVVPAYHSLGLSATPQTFGFDEILVPALGPLIYTYGFTKAIQHKVINNCVLYNIGLSFDLDESMEYDDLSHGIKFQLSKYGTHMRAHLSERDSDFFHTVKKMANDSDPELSAWAINLLNLIYKRRTLVYEASARRICAVDLIASLPQRAKIIVFGERIKQGDLLYEQLLRVYPNQVARYHCEMGDVSKKYAISRYREGEVRILVCCRALDEGFDIPSADVGIVLSSTSTERQRIQRLGRILRRSSGKSISSLYYLFVKETVEDSALLPEVVEGAQEFDLQYNASSGEFSHPTYDGLASQLLARISLQGMDPDALSTIKYCLELGRMRSDWLMDHTHLEAMIASADSISERNYWICMKRLATT